MPKFTPDVAAAITTAATRNGIEAAFLAAIVQQESAGDPFACKYEPQFSYLWNVETNSPFRGALNPATFPAPDFVTSETEWNSQKTSYGVCQVMGAVGRQLGFTGKYLTGLCDPAVGAEFGARLIAELKKRYTDLPDIASAYNAGHSTLADPDPAKGNQTTYVTPVMAFYQAFQAGY